jgi:hypothetical protein
MRCFLDPITYVFFLGAGLRGIGDRVWEGGEDTDASFNIVSGL